jgi:hypothetical protein
MVASFWNVSQNILEDVKVQLHIYVSGLVVWSLDYCKLLKIWGWGLSWTIFFYRILNLARDDTRDHLFFHIVALKTLPLKGGRALIESWGVLYMITVIILSQWWQLLLSNKKSVLGASLNYAHLCQFNECQFKLWTNSVKIKDCEFKLWTIVTSSS